MLHKTRTLGFVSLLELVLLLDLVRGLPLTGSVLTWSVLHVLVVTGGTALLLRNLLSSAHNAQASTLAHTDAQSGNTPGVKSSLQPHRLVLFAGTVALLIPGIGLAGVALAIIHGYRSSLAQVSVPDYWQITPVPTLPYVAPQGRQMKPVDSRGFVEHLLYSTDDQDIYRKVLASGNIRTSLSIDTLKRAMQHRDERVRLTAYKTLDRKVSALNQQIQQLEQAVDSQNDAGSADHWLRIASNYWELITLEGGEPVARRQLLAKASAAAIKVVALQPNNRNAHLVLGRVALAQSDTRRAVVALQRSMALGMPADKVLPYLAECAYLQRDFEQVQQLLAGLDPSIVSYPPLSHVTEYWA